MRALELAAVMETFAPAPAGRSWTAVCVWCLHAADPHEAAPARRVAEHSDCCRCSTTGPDTFVALLPVPA